MEKLNVAIADDNERMVDLLSTLVKGDKELELVGQAVDGQEIYKIIKEKEPDVVLLDIIMPKMDGITVMEKLNEDPSVRKRPAFIIISAVGQERIIEDAFRLGACYYIMKPFDSKEMVARVKAVLRRFQPTIQAANTPEDTLPVEQVTYPDLTINLTDYSVHYKGEVVEMPPKELELFYFLASHPNQVFTREQLLDHIWSYDYIGDTRTVDVHIKRLREKFKDHPAWKLTTVWGIGYKFEYHK